MELRYYPETDMFYISFREGASVDSEEISPGVVVDFDAEGSSVGIEFEDASRKVDLTSLQAFSLPERKLPAGPPSTRD